MSWLKRRGTGQGLGFFYNGVGRKKSNSTEEDGASSGSVGVGAPGLAKATRGTGATANFRDPLNPTYLAKFQFYYAKGKGRNQQIFECSEGHLFWNGKGYLQTTLNGDDAIEFNQEARKRNQSTPCVVTHLPIKYIPSDDSDPVELGTVLGGEFEEFHPKPSTWVRISGITQAVDDSDVKGMLKVALEDDENESIVQVEQRGDGSVYVQFAKVWEARGCNILLNGNEKLFGEKITVKLWYG